MKKVTGYINVRALGTHHFEFFVDDSTTKEQIEHLVQDKCDYYIDYDVEDGYKAVTKTVYEKE